MAEFSIYDIDENPNLPYFKPRRKDAASRLGLRRIEKLAPHESTHIEAPVAPHVTHAPAEHAAAPPAKPPHPVSHDAPPHPGGEIEPRPPPKDNETVNPDGSIEVKGSDGTVRTHEAGDRENPLSNKPQEEVKSKETNEENTAREKEKSSIMENIGKGLMLLPFLLPLALLLAAVCQGEADCQDINGSKGDGMAIPATPPKVMTVTSIVSAAWPNTGISWIPQTNKTKYDIGFTPCIKILANDVLTFTDTTNTFPTGQQSVNSSPQSCMVRIDFGSELTIDPNAANVATFTDKTSCSDRMAYAAGQDAGIIADAAGSGLSSLFGGLLGGLNLSSIFLVICGILALIFAVKFGMAALKKS
jgi:hypothetical protein